MLDIESARRVFEARFKSVEIGDIASSNSVGGKYITVTVGGRHIEGEAALPGQPTHEAAADAWLTAAIAVAGDDDALWWRVKPVYVVLGDGLINVYSRFTTSKL